MLTHLSSSRSSCRSTRWHLGDERAEDSTDDRSVSELSKRDKAMLQRALAEHASEMPDCWDLSQAHRIVADGLRFNDSVPLINHDNVII
jgi:hypothetical protein